VQNNLQELFALLSFVAPHEFSDANKFLKLSKEEMHEVLRRFMLRRLLPDVNIQLPLRIDISLMCPLSKLQRKVLACSGILFFVICQKKKGVLGGAAAQLVVSSKSLIFQQTVQRADEFEKGNCTSVS
jgi:hypothetical protein